MGPTQPPLHSAKILLFHAVARIALLPSFAAVLFALLTCSLAHAQGGVPLVTVATDQSVSSSLSNQFGVPAGQAVDQAGDLVFIGDGRSGLFFRPAGAASATRLLQTGEPVPGFPGSHVIFFAVNVSINSFGKIYFEVVFSLPDGENHQALMIYDGTSYHTIVSSESLAPPIATAPNLGGPNVTFGTTFTPLTQGINDNGDVAFTAVPDATGLETLYIVPAGKTPLAVVTANEPSLPPFSGTLLGVFSNPTSGLNAFGQVLFSTSVVGFVGTELFVASEANGGEVFKVASIGDTFCGGGATVSSLSSTSAVLNNLGGYAFIEQAVISSVTQSALCVGVVGGAPTKAVGSGTAAPSPIVSGTLGVVGVNSALALDDSGDIAFVSPITGSATTTSALLRYTKAGGQLSLVAYNGEPAPGLSGQFLSSSFAPFSIGSNSTVAFEGTTGGGSCAPTDNCGVHTVYEQSGAATPVVVATDGQASTLTGAGTLFCPGCVIAKQLNNGSVFFDSLVQGGTAYYGQFIGTPGSLQALMNTGDTLPTASRVSLLGIIARASGNWVGFTAQKSGGRLSLFVSNTSTVTTTKAVSEGDAAPGTGGAIATANQNFFVNANGGLAFNARVSGTIGGGRSAGTAFFTWSPGAGLVKAVALGDATPISGTVFEAVTFNSVAPAPFNSTGQLAFEAGYEGTTGGTGVFLFSPASGGTIAKIAAAGDAAPGGGTFLSFSTSNGFNYGVNQTGQVAFGATRTAGGAGFFIGAAGVSPEVVAVPGTSTNLGVIANVVQFSGFNDSGVLSFEGSTSLGTEALFTGAGAPATPTPSVLAESGEGVSGGGSLSLGSAALNNDENDLAFLSSISNGNANSGLFIDPGTGPNAGTLQPVIVQGQAAPGGSTFTTLYSPSYALGPDGELIASASYANGLYNPANLGVFLVRQNGAVARVLGAGDTVPGGGTASQLRVGQGLAAGAAGEFAFWASINGGSAQQAIFATAVPTGTTSSAVTLGSSANPVLAGGLVTLTATVATGLAGTPTGSVTFYDNGVSLGTRTLAGGQAQLSTGSLLIGPHPITAQYSGDTNYAPGNSNVLDETITGPGTNATSTTLTATPDPSAIGQSVTFTATVTSGAGTPFGTVSFFSGAPLSGVLLGSGTLNGSGQATLNTSFSPSGTSTIYFITAQYDGASTFAASTSTSLLQSVIAPDEVFPPVISSISPNAVPAAGGAFTLIVNGTGFVSGSVVQWNGAARATTFVNPTQLTASIASADINVTGWDQVTVSNFSVAPLVSNAVAFQVTSGSGPTIGTALNYVPVTPCRLVDTRTTPNGPFAGPSITGGTSRNFTIPQNTTCNIPSTAAAYSLNVAVIPSAVR
jgi:hypothetical protein